MPLTLDRLYKVEFSTDSGDTITVDFEENAVTFDDGMSPPYELPWTDLCDLMSYVERMLNGKSSDTA